MVVGRASPTFLGTNVKFLPSCFFETRTVGAFRRLQTKGLWPLVQMSNFYLQTDRQTDGRTDRQINEVRALPLGKWERIDFPYYTRLPNTGSKISFRNNSNFFFELEEGVIQATLKE